MKLSKNLQLWLVLVVFLATIAILFGGQTLTSMVRVEKPLKNEIATAKEVNDYKVKQSSDGIQLDLKLRKSPNLQQTLEFVKQKTEQYYKKPVTSFKIADKPNAHLQKIRYELSFYLEEALKSGRYIQLKNALDLIENEDVTAKIYLSNQFIYVQLEEGTNYLYQALPRSVASSGNESGGDTV